MAAYDIQKHFKGLRADTGRRRGRDPFATGFEDDSDEDRMRTRTKTTKPPPVKKPSPAAPLLKNGPSKSAFASIDPLRDGDDYFLNEVPPPEKNNRIGRHPSPAPAKLAQTRVSNGAGRRGSIDSQHLQGTRRAVALAAGPLAYLDDSEDDDFLPRSRRDRRPSPAPRKQSDSPRSRERSVTPRGDKRQPREPQLSRHTVASPFAGTKYLQDSDSEDDRDGDSDKSSNPRQGSLNSLDSETAVTTPDENGNVSKPNLEVKQVEKRKHNGSGVSWRAFSAGRSEQRHAEIEALQASLMQRGRRISFNPQAVTDDGRKVPLAPGPNRFAINKPTTTKGRTKSPSRRIEDVRPADDELPPGGPVRPFDPTAHPTQNAFTGMLPARVACS